MPQLDRKGQLVYLEKEKLLLTPSSSVELSKLMQNTDDEHVEATNDTTSSAT